jgi:hypothetical protein
VVALAGTFAGKTLHCRDLNCNLSQVRVVDTNTVQAHRSGVSVGIVLSRLMPVYQEQVLTRSRRAIQAKAAGVLLAGQDALG